MKGFWQKGVTILLFLAGTSVVAGTPQVTLSPYAETVCRVIKFDRQVLVTMKQESGASIHRMIGYDENGFQIIADGVYVPVPDDRTEQVLESLRKKLSPGYMPFVIEINGIMKIDKIAVVKTSDQYDILRMMQTAGEDYDIANSDVIERLKDWEKTSPFTILGADTDWVELEFKVLPRDLKAFVEEVYDFCPDAVDQGPGTTAGLSKELQATRKLFLWWD